MSREQLFFDCDCCKKQTVKKLESAGYVTYNLDETPHEKHLKVWAVSVASAHHKIGEYEQNDPDEKIGEMTFAMLERHIENKLNMKFGSYYHGQRKMVKTKIICL